MRNFVIWCVVLLTMAGTAFSKAPEPAEPGKAPQKSGAGGKTEGTPKELAVDLGGGVKMEMVLVPAGDFTMGDDKSGRVDEKPIHKVNITKPFYLGKHEVTQEQWEAVMGNNPSRFKGPKNPVEQVSWDECQTFFNKLNAKTGGQGSKFVLPTEAQWEYACRAGSTSKFCFGDDENQLGEYAWYVENSDGKTHAVGGKKPNTFGLYDMHGNVWEWCEDWFGGDYYAKSPTDDPRGPTTGSVRVSRGGSWGLGGVCQSAYRFSLGPGRRFRDLGLRVARVPAESGTLATVEGTLKEPVVALAQGSARTWTDSSGTYTTNAEFVAYDSGSGQVTLRRVDGEVITMDLSQLSEYDQGYVRRTPKELAVDLGRGVKMEMVLVPAGEFAMGSYKSRVDRQEPVHKVNITKPFYLGKYEVTQEQWEAVMGNNPSAFKGPKNPVEQVPWDECQTFFNKLNAKTGGQGSKFVLPTEAQWEYACRAGSTSEFYFGDDENQLGEYAWYSKNSDGKTHPVGEKKPNTFGLHDMHGNVWEWCADWFGSDYYAKSPTDDPRGPTTGSRRVARGDGWLGHPRGCRSAGRLDHPPVHHRRMDLGFRVAQVRAE